MIAQAELLTREQVPVDETWDLTTIYADDAHWEGEMTLARELIASAASHRGHLHESAQRIRTALDDSVRLQQVIERLFVYAKLRLDENTADHASLGRLDRVTALSIEAGESLAFFDPEVLSLPEEHLNLWIDDPVLEKFRHLLDDLLRNRPHTRSVEIEELLAQSADLARAPREIFSALDNADLEYGTVLDEDGNAVKLTKGRYQAFMESKNREVRKNAYDALMSVYAAHRFSFAAMHASSVRKDVFYARARGHLSARESALFSYNIPISVYDSLIATTREARPVIERFMDLRRRALGLEKLAPYDLYVQLAPIPERTYEYLEAVDLVARGAEALGESYVNDLIGGLTGRWVDVRETKGKRSGAYSWGAYGSPPVILMNWNGTVDHVFTLSHEAGHAMHTYLSDRAQPYHKAQYSIFLAEIASTLNEVLLTWQLLREIEEHDIKARFAILNRLADMISGTLVRQVMFAEFELRTHEVAERGEALTLETISATYSELYDVYVPGVTKDEITELSWVRVPHFYGAFYVYQYATGISAGISLARAIRDEGAPATERYLSMLRSGGSDYPLAILQRAGVDLSSPEPVRAALAEFDATIREMERLVELGALEA